MSTEVTTSVEEALSNSNAETFNRWYQEREHRNNIRNGTPFFNGPDKIKSPTRQSPSQLLQCHRKTTYEQLNAPEETVDPNGIFWFGSRFEEDIVLPFLQEAVTGPDTYACNSLWIDFTMSSEVGDIRFKGETDPAIVDEDGIPLLLFEVKTKRTIENTDAPNRHHKAQVHAYLHGLSEKYERDLRQAVLLYGSRTKLDIKTFHIEFDDEFWAETVQRWASQQKAYRLFGELPPADPEYDWECKFCPYQERCGRGKREYEETGATGLLPLFTEYPREKLLEYVQSHEEAKLTPTLAHEFPRLAEQYGVFDWYCSECSQSFAWDSVDWSEHSSTPPECPACDDDDTSRQWLRGPEPRSQHRHGGGDNGA